MNSKCYNALQSDVAELRDLVTNGPCEFIGCGYTQIIGPLVPAEVNEVNFRIGMQRYEALLARSPWSMSKRTRQAWSRCIAKRAMKP